MTKPVLYSFRRCPYAIRARMALVRAGIECEKIEVDLKNKPAEMLAISPKGTVPVLIMPDDTVVDESLDIMYYALAKADPEGWLALGDEDKKETENLIRKNDDEFKKILDKYKYHTRFPEKNQQDYRREGEKFLQILEEKLCKKKFLFADKITVADIAIFPFIRQWAGVEEDNLEKFRNLKNWLEYHKQSELFKIVMKKDK